MRPGNDQTLLVHQKLVVQNLRHRLERNALVEDELQFDIAS